MKRRRAILTLLASLPPIHGGPPVRLGRFLNSYQGTALLIDVASGRLLAAAGETMAASLFPPGSTLKPFVISSLLRSGKLTPDTAIPCLGALRIGGRDFQCVHPRLARPMQPHTAIAYSCNQFIASACSRAGPDELLQDLGELSAGTEGIIRPPKTPDALRLLALGYDGIAVTAAGLAMAYRRLARNIPEPVLKGLEGAVEYGTARYANIPEVKMAGKTGSARTAKGSRVAWFAGFFPSREPQVAVTVLLYGRSGGADAAPIAGRIAQAWWRREL
ncbi:MAG: hypothetical protein FJW20_16365 [Acidimicrobiia bacterium]|nr:hypothetical protein [Acidimicrobiia bacterium]